MMTFFEELLAAVAYLAIAGSSLLLLCLERLAQ